MSDVVTIILAAFASSNIFLVTILGCVNLTLYVGEAGGTGKKSRIMSMDCDTSDLV